MGTLWSPLLHCTLRCERDSNANNSKQINHSALQKWVMIEARNLWSDRTGAKPQCSLCRVSPESRVHWAPSINGDNLLGWASQVEAYLVVQDLLVATRAASTVGINLQGGKDTVLVQGNEGGRTRIGLGEIEISSVHWYWDHHSKRKMCLHRGLICSQLKVHPCPMISTWCSFSKDWRRRFG